MNKFYSYGKQVIEDKDIESVAEVLKSDWLTTGPLVEQFEGDLCQKFNAKYASVVCNGTAALHLIAMALDWKKGDIVITAPLTFLASANCIEYVDATADFVDIDPVSYTIDLNQLEDKIKSYNKAGKRVKAVVAIDYAGHPCNWPGLKEMSGKYGFQLVDDACHALGATFPGEKIGSATYCDAVAFSFHPVKHITTGEGGAVLTNDENADRRVKRFRNHGMVKDPTLLENQNEGSWYYEMPEFGFNYRLTDLQCALGISQLGKLDKFLQARREIAAFYNKALAGEKKLITPKVQPDYLHAYHLYPLQVKFDEISLDKKEYYSYLKDHNIGCQIHYFPVHLQPYYRNKYGFKEGDFPESELFYRRVLSIPMYPGLTADDLQYISRFIVEGLETGI